MTRVINKVYVLFCSTKQKNLTLFLGNTIISLSLQNFMDCFVEGLRKELCS